MHDTDESREERIESGDVDGGRGVLSRRRFLQTTAATGALALGATGAASAAENCSADATMDVDGGEYVVINNDWGAPLSNGHDQCVFTNSDGSYGWSWDRRGFDNINYPQALVGGKPWGTMTNTSILPKRWGDIDSFEMAVDIDMQIEQDGNWDLAEEFWVTRDQIQPGQTADIKNEVMLLFDWGSGHDHRGPRDRNAITDKYGNNITLWVHYTDVGEQNWSFYIFRIEGRPHEGKVDLRAIMDYLENNVGEHFSDNHYVSGVELGNENWKSTAGRTTLNAFDVKVNDQVVASGVDDQSPLGSGDNDPGSGPDTTPPSQPSGLYVSDTSQSSVTVGWSPSSDDGTGVDHYVVSAGGREMDVAAGTTQATIDGLSSGRSYQVSVSAVDGAGNESAAATTQASTDEEQQTATETLSVDLPATKPSVGDTVDASLVLSGTPGGLSGYTIQFSVDDPSVATVEGATVHSDLSRMPGSSSESSITIGAGDFSERIQTDVGRLELATVTLKVQGSGSTAVSLSVERLNADSGSLSADTQGATLSVESSEDEMEPVMESGRMPQDMDADGHYEDVTGDGEVDFNDLVAYYQHKDDPSMTDHMDAYDYTGDGELDFNDLVALYQNYI